MIRRVFLLFFGIMIVGFAPAVAQNYFIKQDKSPVVAGEKPTLFNKLKQTTTNKKKSVIKYADKLKVKQLKAKSFAKANSLDYWRESGKKPTNAQEITMYADAHRAVAQQNMYRRREALIAHIQKQELKEQGRVSNKSVGAYSADTSKGTAAKASADDAKVKKAKKSSTKKPKVFVKKSKDDKAKPTKVFNNYR